MGKTRKDRKEDRDDHKPIRRGYKGRKEGKALIARYLETSAAELELEKEYLLDQEADEASYCHKYGPCDKCLME